MKEQLRTPTDSTAYLLLREGRISEFNALKAQNKIADLTNLDLRGTTLSGLDAEGLDLSGCYFRQADLRGIDFSRTNLRGASFNLDAAVEPVARATKVPKMGEIIVK